MFRKETLAIAVFFYMAVSLVSCTPNKGSGILGPKAMEPTYTPTATPDASYRVLIHQQGTPAAGVALSMSQVSSGMSVTATTGADGTAALPVHAGGKWDLTVGSFNGFDNQKFTVEPLSNTFYAVDYGIPSLELELVSGNEMIPIAPSTLVYKVTYRTKYPRYVKLETGIVAGIPIQISKEVFRYDGDESTIEIIFPKSFENYSVDDKTMLVQITGKPSSGDIVYSNSHTLTKNWRLNMSVDCHYMAWYQKTVNDGHTVFVIGIRDIDLSLSYNIFFNGAVNYEVIDAANVGDAGTKPMEYTGYVCMPEITGFGCFTVAAFIPTDAGWAYACGHPDNYGWMTVRIFDGGNLDVTRTFATQGSWGITCSNYCCMFLGASAGCGQVCGTVPPAGACTIGSVFTPTNIYRERSEKINITK